MEILTVSEEGCFIQKTDQSTGMTYLYQLNDIKDVLELPTSQLIPGPTAHATISSPMTIMAGQSA